MTNHHPTRAQLKAFSLGQLPPADAVAVEDHVGDCEPCCETLLGLSDDDTFVALLQEANQPPSDETLNHIDDLRAASLAPDEIPAPLAEHPRYEIVAPIGTGGMGNVYKAEHRMMERTVALKVIKRKLFRNPTAVQRFQREVKSAARLSHPNIVTAHDAEQAGDVNFLVMEYVEGVDLAQKVQDEGALPIKEACEYIFQTALGLQHAHQKDMVHRDIKPHNLMVTSDRTVKILDFGLATLATDAIQGVVADEPSGVPTENTPKDRLTTMGTMMGTPDFISPEQAGQPHEVDIRSDIYSLGCTFYFLLSGRPPFAGGSVMEKVSAHAHEEAEPIENVRVDVPEEVADVLRRMMAKDPGERFQTPAEVADALASFVDAHRTTSVVAQKHDPAIRTALRNAWWPPSFARILVVGAVALVLGAIISVATDRGTLEIESVDESIEVIIRPVNSDTDEGNTDRHGTELEIVDTVTGSTVKKLRSGEYELDIKGDDNGFELSEDRFVLRRGETVLVTVTKSASHAASLPDFELRPEPWTDGETLQYQMKLASGFDIGKFVFAVRASEDEGKEIWQSRVGRYIVSQGLQVYSSVKADRDTFRPRFSVFRHPILGHFEASYAEGEVTVRTVNVDDEKPNTRNDEIDGIYYDNEQAMLLFRRLPLTMGFSAKIPLYSTFSEGAIVIESKVNAVETVEVPAGTFECYRLNALNETYWISTDEHRYPVKFEAGGLTGVLETIRVSQPGETIEFRDDVLGFSAAVPSDWHFGKYKDPDDENEEIYHLLDPEAVAASKLVAVPGDKLKEWLAGRLPDDQQPSPRTWLDVGIERRQRSRHNFVIRPDSWTERTISGNPGVSYIADYEDRGKNMVYYVVCSLGQSTGVQFQTRVERDQFDRFKGAFDAIVATYRE